MLVSKTGKPPPFSAILFFFHNVDNFYQELLKETAIPDWKEIGRES